MRARLAPLPPIVAALRTKRHATYEALHAMADVFQSPGARTFLVTAHELVAEGLRSPDFRANKRARFFAQLDEDHALDGETRRRLEELYDGWLMLMDPPEHPRYRRLTLSALAAAPLGSGALRAFGRGGDRMEAISTLMMPYLRVAMAALVGCSTPTYARLVRASEPILELFLGRMESAVIDPGQAVEARDTIESLLRRCRPGGLVDNLCQHIAADDPRRIPLLVSLVADTWEPVLALMSAGVLYGLTRRGDRCLFQNGLDMGSFFREIARLETPFQICDRRVGPRGASLGGVRFEPEDTVVFAVGAANRDPRAFARPRAFDLDRGDSARPLSFGAGAHACLGARGAFEICTRFWEHLSHRLARRPLKVEAFRWRPVVGTRILDSLALRRA